MYRNLLSNPWMTPGFGFSLLGNILLIAVVVWSITWKGLALWKSARNEHKVWFVVFLVLNTLGILEILYFYVFSKKKVTVATIPPTEEKK